jgi:hypothetical protein
VCVCTRHDVLLEGEVRRLELEGLRLEQREERQLVHSHARLHLREGITHLCWQTRARFSHSWRALAPLRRLMLPPSLLVEPRRFEVGLSEQLTARAVCKRDTERPSAHDAAPPDMLASEHLDVVPLLGTPSKRRHLSA